MAMRVKVNGVEYRVPRSVHDITLRTHLEIVKAENTRMPAGLKAIMEEKTRQRKQLIASRVPKRMYAREFLPYYAHVISLATGIPEEQIRGNRKFQGMPVAMIDAWYWGIMRAYAAFEPAGVTRFEIDGQTFALPPDYMETSHFGEFAEAAQYEDYVADVATGNWSSMPKLLAVLIRPEVDGVRERYDPDTFDAMVDERAELFLDQPMALVYEAAFFLLRRSAESRTDSLIYTIARQLATSKRESIALPIPTVGISA